MAKIKRKKGIFSKLELPIKQGYVFPVSRKQMILAGALLCLGIFIFFLFNSAFQKSSFILRGPLSSNHADFEEECSKCHKKLESVTNQKCSICHEKTRDSIGIYTFAAHYIYQSRDLKRIKSSQMEYGNLEQPCYSCHPEHLGRESLITRVPDVKCTRCHVYGSFNKNHPDFEFSRNHIPDDSTLIFTHIRHTKFVLEFLEKKEGTTYIENACLYCHNPDPDGMNFKPLDYDTHCGDCHLTADKETALLNVKDPQDPTKPGVETLQMIRRRGGPGTRWAFYINPNEFKILAGGRKVKKSPVYHEDPWVLENLKQIRRTLYPDLKLADLLKTSGKVFNKTNNMFYQEAIIMLKEYITQLRGRPEPEIQQDLLKLDSLLTIAQKKIQSPYYPLVDSLFRTSSLKYNPNLTQGQIENFKKFALKLTGVCQECHLVKDASILRVAKEQEILIRAKFDHRAHIFERRCLECHVDIPITADMTTTPTLDPKKDRAAIQNIPNITNCQECHNQQQASNRCVTCHYFHPNKQNRGNLKLFVEGM